MWKNNQFENHETSNKNNSLDRGAQISLWGSAISTFGDALQTIGSVISIEEGRISDAQQQQELEKLQSQIDELKKEESQNNAMNSNVEMLGTLLERLVERLENDKS
ncbi:hypothetical protein [Sporosarcina limicola]|uniref:RNase H-like nuclease (RuvC/YqgF family) n=1 Tax=Sporosarcina limicola TaxID=34101 RepID=A0A927R732_9BACL|nr:hypothetical protein [Sporosarcina limicola]MBE1555554.1 putative RNase H-like nuclease (RuvC/YqgF family) [Sporosarcina limicola]